MKYFLFIILLAISVAPIDLNAQESMSKKKLRPSKVYINEINLFDKEENFDYRSGRGAYEWIEIFNGTNKTINIEDYFLTDDLREPSKWAINPIHKSNIWLKKKKFFPVYLHNRARRNGALINDFESNKQYLFLVKKENGTTTVMDTIKLPSDQKYPYSRYPDGGEFTTSDWLTPGSENLLLRDSESKNTYGVSAQLGWSTSISDEWANASRPKLAGGLGLYSRKNLGFLTLEYGLRVGMRGFRIDQSGSQPTTTGSWYNTSKGKRNIYYIDLPYYFGTNLFKNLSFFGGPMFSIRIKTFTSYKTDRVFTYNNPNTPPVYQSTTYRSQEGNPALDLIDLSFTIGLRYQFHKTLNFSIYYMSDLTGLNIGAGNAFATQQNNGIYFSVERPLLFSRKRVKRKGIF